MTVSVMAVCSYNRVRSVMVERLLRRATSDAGVEASVHSAGFADGGRPAMPEAVQVLRRLHIDATDHISRRVDVEMTHTADLVLTAERLHVMRLVEDDSRLFKKVFTLPEFAALAELAGPRGARPMAEWLDLVGLGRTHATFLAAQTPEISDPTGMTPAAFAATADRIDGWCRTIAGLL
jgi:protein-tyrosine phosphatase